MPWRRQRKPFGCRGKSCDASSSAGEPEQEHIHLPNTNDGELFSAYFPRYSSALSPAIWPVATENPHEEPVLDTSYVSPTRPPTQHPAA